METKVTDNGKYNIGVFYCLYVVNDVFIVSYCVFFSFTVPMFPALCLCFEAGTSTFIKYLNDLLQGFCSKRCPNVSIVTWSQTPLHHSHLNLH